MELKGVVTHPLTEAKSLPQSDHEIILRQYILYFFREAFSLMKGPCRLYEMLTVEENHTVYIIT